MNSIYRFFIVYFLILSLYSKSQTYQITGGPLKLSGWDVSYNAESLNDYIKLTSDERHLVGALFLLPDLKGYLPNIKLCNKWKAQFNFEITGKGSSTHGFGDGFAFWHMVGLPREGEFVYDLGLTEASYGLIIGFDTYNDIEKKPMNKIHILYGENIGNLELNENAYHSPDFTDVFNLLGVSQKFVEIYGEKDPSDERNWIIRIDINGQTLVNQVISPSGKAKTMTAGSFGLSASTKDATAKHIVKNIKIYVERVSILTEKIFVKNLCPNPETAETNVDLTVYNNKIVLDPTLYDFTYYKENDSEPIINPQNYLLENENEIVRVVISDVENKLCSRESFIYLNTKKLIEEILY